LSSDEKTVLVELTPQELQIAMGAISAFLGVPFVRRDKPRIAQHETELLDALHERLCHLRGAGAAGSPETRITLNLLGTEARLLETAVSACASEYGECQLDLRMHLNTPKVDEVSDLQAALRARRDVTS
jgi:hypothetical protein